MSTKDAAKLLVPLVGPDRAAELLGGLSPRTLERWRIEGRGPAYVRVGRLIRYRTEDLEQFVAAGRQSAA